VFQINPKEWSSLLIVFSFLQFGIMQPFAILLGSQAIIAITTIVIFIFLLLIFRFNINKYVYYTFIVMSVLFLTNYFLFDGKEITLLLFGEFALKSFSLFLIGSFPFSTFYLKKYFSFFSIVNFFSLLIIVIFGYIETFSYMRFGYALLPTLLFSIYALRDNKNRIIWLLILISSFIMILIYGSRGPLLGLFIFIFIVIFTDSKMKISSKILTVIGMGTAYVYLIPYNGFLKILDFIYYELNLKTYSIFKLKVMLEKGLVESSSGRDYLYENFLEQIMFSPIFGNGIGITQELWGVSPHNLFLQILIEFGVIGMGIFLTVGISLYFLLTIIRKKDNELFLLLLIIFSVSFSRLLVSSDLWLRQELWLFFSMVINSFLIIKFKVPLQQKTVINNYLKNNIKSP